MGDNFWACMSKDLVQLSLYKHCMLACNTFASYKQAITSIILKNLVEINTFKIAKDFSITSKVL